MHNKYLNTLEYPKILKELARYAGFSASKALIAQLTPSPYFSEVETLQAETSEARHLLSVQADISVGGITDVRPLLAQAQRGILIMPLDLLSIVQTLTIARDLRRKLTRMESRYPLLADYGYRLEETGGLVNQINQCIDENGELKNNASPELSRIRRELDVTHNRLQEKMRKFVGAERIRKYLQEDFFTQRDGRYVLPLKADFKGRVKGIIHDQSASGATIFVEPMGVVDLNNDWKRLQIEESQEIARILTRLTAEVASQSVIIAATVQTLAELDLVFAKARYAETIAASAPVLKNWDDLPADTPRIHLRQARHPLLNPETVVPIDLLLSPQTKMLVITGPNTGGKTVSLKTAGLLALMAQSGLHIPADDGSQMLVFDNIFADIGDEQSLEQSLSTFSSHMTNIVAILKESTEKSLVIFDELGAGTDPIEGAALAHAIMDSLLEKGTTTLVATHYAELKAFAYTTSGIENASMAFDVETLSPTYKLQLGVPGNSNAFAIAERLGLGDEILARAETLVDTESRATEDMLSQIKADLEAARMERLRVEEERAEAEYYRQKIEDRLANVDAEGKKILKRARIEAQKELDETRKTLRTLRRDAKKSTVGRASAEKPLKPIEKQLSKIEDALTAKLLQSDNPTDKTLRRPLKVGSKVDIPHLNAKGVVTAINADEIEVQLGNFRTTLKRQKILGVENTSAPAKDVPPSSQKTRSNGIVESPGLEIDLRGQNSDDALHLLDSYLDQAYLAALPFVRIIHGKGSGILRKAVRAELDAHPLITSHRSGKENEGGDGVTVAKLAVD